MGLSGSDHAALGDEVGFISDPTDRGDQLVFPRPEEMGVGLVPLPHLEGFDPGSE